MSDDTIAKAEIVTFPLPDDSHVMTFHLDEADLRGRIVRLGSVLREILEPLDYPRQVERLIIEAVSLTVLLSSMLKYDGIFILQAQGKGPVTRLVCDMTSKGDVRATASFDKDALAMLPADVEIPLVDVMGDGYLAFTVDQGEYTERYQGIVELQKDSLEQTIQHYFQQSEQIKTSIRLAMKIDEQGQWNAGGIMLQHLPNHDKIPQDAKPKEDNWVRAQILLTTCKDEELLDMKLRDETLLYRLFHEEGVRVYAPLKITKGCRCNMPRILGILKSLNDDEKKDVIVDGKVIINCEFCNKNFEFKPEEIA
jgi:molecular chaperone Hsp33